MIGGVVGFFLLAVLVPILVGEARDLAPSLAAWILRWGARRIGRADQARRYEEEWLADLDRVPGKATKLAHACGVLALSVPLLRARARRNLRGALLPGWITGRGDGLPIGLTPAERAFFVALRNVVAASGLSLRALAAMTSPPAPEATQATEARWRRWLNAQSLPPRKAVRKLAEAVAMAGTDPGNLVELWSLAFMPTQYPQEPGFTLAQLRQLPTAAPHYMGRTTEPGAGELRDRGAGQPDSEDPASSAGATFSNSYQQLTGQAARMFRLLSLHPGPDIGLQAAASLAAVPVEQASKALDELARACLVEENLPDRFACHDLPRAYAAEQARASESATELDTALGRLLDHYLWSMRTAVSLAYRAPVAFPIPAPRPGVLPESFKSGDHARAWCHAELRAIQSLLTHAAERGLDDYCWQIPLVMALFLLRGGFLHVFLDTQRIALAAARKLGDPLALGHAHYHFAHACALLGEVADSDGHLRDALGAFSRAGDQAGAARTLNAMAQVLMQQGEYHGALEREKEALRLRLALGDRYEIAHSEETIGTIYARLGEHQQALRHCYRSLDLSRETGARLLAADALATLGFVHLALGDAAEAIASYMEVLAIYRQANEKQSAALALVGLGDAQQAVGDPVAARASWQQALTLLRGQPNADDQPVRARLGQPCPT